MLPEVLGQPPSSFGKEECVVPEAATSKPMTIFVLSFAYF
jgi:hypothetical protein